MGMEGLFRKICLGVVAVHGGGLCQLTHVAVCIVDAILAQGVCDDAGAILIAGFVGVHTSHIVGLIQSLGDNDYSVKKSDTRL